MPFCEFKRISSENWGLVYDLMVRNIFFFKKKTTHLKSVKEIYQFNGYSILLNDTKISFHFLILFLIKHVNYIYILQNLIWFQNFLMHI